MYQGDLRLKVKGVSATDQSSGWYLKQSQPGFPANSGELAPEVTFLEVLGLEFYRPLELQRTFGRSIVPN